MAIDNTITVTGNVTDEPALKYLSSGVNLVNFSVAVNRRWMNRSTNEWEEDVSFFPVVAWRDLAENVAESVGKGTRVTVTGRLEQSTWKTEEGENRSRVEIVADDVGVSLRWATAEARRAERRTPEMAGAGAVAAPNGSGATGASGEEPF